MGSAAGAGETSVNQRRQFESLRCQFLAFNATCHLTCQASFSCLFPFPCAFPPVNANCSLLLGCSCQLREYFDLKFGRPHPNRRRAYTQYKNNMHMVHIRYQSGQRRLRLLHASHHRSFHQFHQFHQFHHACYAQGRALTRIPYISVNFGRLTAHSHPCRRFCDSRTNRIRRGHLLTSR